MLSAFVAVYKAQNLVLSRCIQAINLPLNVSTQVLKVTRSF